MNKKSFCYALILIGFILVARKTYLVGLLNPPPATFEIWDTSIQMTGGLLMGLGGILLARICSLAKKESRV